MMEEAPEVTNMKKLAGDVVKAMDATQDGLGVADLRRTEGQPSFNTLLSSLSEVADVNASILTTVDEKFECKLWDDYDVGVLITLQSVSRQPHLSVLHLQFIIGMVWDENPSVEEQMLAVASLGGDIDMPISGIKCTFMKEWHNRETTVFEAVGATSLKEIILDFSRRRPKFFFEKNSSGLRPFKKNLLEIIKKARTANPFPKYRTVPPFWKNLLLSENFSDVKLLCTDGTTYPAHQNVLASASVYFNTYFTGPWSRLPNNTTTTENRRYETQVDSTILKYILSYIYTNGFGASVAGMTTSTICNILKSAHEFQMDDLVDGCCKILGRKIDLDNIKEITCTAAMAVSSLLDNASGEEESANYNNPKVSLWVRCAKFVRDHAADVLLKSDFSSLKGENPQLWENLTNEVSSPRKRSPRKRKRDEDGDEE